MQQKPNKNVGLMHRDCRCWRCARAIPHKAEDHPRCECGAMLGALGTIVFCDQHLKELTKEEREEHAKARKGFHALGSGRLDY